MQFDLFSEKEQTQVFFQSKQNRFRHGRQKDQMDLFTVAEIPKNKPQPKPVIKIQVVEERPAKQIVEITDVQQEIRSTPDKKDSPYQAKSIYNPTLLYSSKKEDRLAKNKRALELVEGEGDKQEVFSSYSGVGKLIVDYDSDKSMSENLQERREKELHQFFTPPEIAKLIVEILEPEEGKKVIDLTCGHGIFFNYLPHCACQGIEIQDKAVKVARYLYPDAKIIQDSMEYSSFENQFDYSIGNPPFSLKFQNRTKDNPLSSEEGNIYSQDLYLYKSWASLKPGGFLFMLSASSWLTEPKLKHKKVCQWIEENLVQVVEIHLPNNVFKRLDCIFPTKLLLFQKKYEGLDYSSQFKSKLSSVDNTKLLLALWRESSCYQEFLENKRLAATYQIRNRFQEHFSRRKEEDGFRAQYRKIFVKYLALKQQGKVDEARKLKAYLYDCLSAILEDFSSEHRREKFNELADQLALSVEQVEELKSHFTSKPKLNKNDYLYDRWEELSLRYSLKEVKGAEDWHEKKPSLGKAWKLAKRLLKKKPEENLVKVIKTKDSIKIVPCSKQAIGALNNLDISAELRKWNLNKLIIPHWLDYQKQFRDTLEKLNKPSISYRTKKLNHIIKIQWDTDVYSYLVKRKKRFDLNRFPLQEIDQVLPDKYDFWLKKTKELVFANGGKPFEYQTEDLAKAMIRGGTSYLNFEVGTGKTVMYLSYVKLLGGVNVFCTMSMLIKQFIDEIKIFYPELSYQVVKDITTLEQAIEKKVNIIILSYHALRKLIKRVKKYKYLYNSVTMDEAWSAKNSSSQIHRAVRELFNVVPRKMLMSGTMIDNNVVEAYVQYLCLYSSPEQAECLCTVPMVKAYDRSAKEEVSKPNPKYMLSFGAKNDSGESTFRKCHSPKRQSVFGSEGSEQSIINHSELTEFIKPLRLRRDFIEAYTTVWGVEPQVNRQSVLVDVSPVEAECHNYIFNDLQELLRKYNTQELGHEARFATLIAIGQTVQQLLKVTSCWFGVRGYGKKYDQPHISSKMIAIREKLQELITENQKRKIVLCSIHKESTAKMYEYLKDDFNVVYLPVNEGSMEKRYQLLDKFKKGSANIFLSTAGKLSAGLNIGEANDFIIDSLFWTATRLKQVEARIARVNCPPDQPKNIWYFLGKNTFDQNLWNLVLRKAMSQSYVQDDEIISREDQNESLGGLSDLLNLAVTREKDEDGKAVFVNPFTNKYCSEWEKGIIKTV